MDYEVMSYTERVNRTGLLKINHFVTLNKITSALEACRGRIRKSTQLRRHCFHNLRIEETKKKNFNFLHLVEDLWVTLVCSVVLKITGIELSPMATLLVFIIGLLPLSCHHSEHFFSQGTVFWDSWKLGSLGLLNSVAATATVSCCMQYTQYPLMLLILNLCTNKKCFFQNTWVRRI